MIYVTASADILISIFRFFEVSTRHVRGFQGLILPTQLKNLSPHRLSIEMTSKLDSSSTEADERWSFPTSEGLLLILSTACSFPAGQSREEEKHSLYVVFIAELHLCKENISRATSHLGYSHLFSELHCPAAVLSFGAMVQWEQSGRCRHLEVPPR